jgi:NAD(P)-dependent dehydrogenase (short-subunit alcohol dehydrogenase family)
MGSETAKKVTWMKCDLTDWKAVAETAKKITDSTDRLDILINNAARGIMTYKLTKYGVDEHMGVRITLQLFLFPVDLPYQLNHMGHVVLTSHLLPLLKKTASKGNSVRIVCLGSNAHRGTPSDCKFFSLPELNQDLGPNAQYGRSKLAQMLYAKYLSKNLISKYPNILTNAVHPGFVSTRQSKELIHEAFPLGGYAMSVGMEPFKKDQFEGCVSAMFAATKTSKSGQYICPPAIPEEGSKLFQDDELMENLISLTKQVVQEKTKSDSVDKGCPFNFI